MSAPSDSEVVLNVLDREGALALLDKQARKLLGMSGEEFVRAFNDGRFDDVLERPDIARLSMLILPE